MYNVKLKKPRKLIDQPNINNFNYPSDMNVNPIVKCNMVLKTELLRKMVQPNEKKKKQCTKSIKKSLDRIFKKKAILTKKLLNRNL